MYNELCIIRKVNFVLYNGALTLKMSNMVLDPFCDETLPIYTGWPRKNATTLIVNFKNIVDETELFFYFIW